MLSGFASALMFISLLGSLTVQSHICAPPSAPTITTPLHGATIVSGQPFAVSGNADSDASVVISSNATDILTLQADETSQYFGNITLDNEGEYVVSVRAERSCGSTLGESVTLFITSAPEGEVPVSPVVPSRPPTHPSEEYVSVTSDEQNTSHGLFLSITSPRDRSVTRESSAFVGGSTSEAATVTIAVNRETVGTTHTPRMTFGMNVPLVVGENTIVIVAASTTGTASVSLTVIREDASKRVPWYETKAAKTIIVTTAVGGLSFFAATGIIRIAKRIS